MNELKSLFQLPKELLLYNYLKAFIAFTWALLFAIIAKLEGLYLTISVISIFMLLNRFSQVALIFFKKLKFIQIFKIVLLIDIIYFVGSFLYYKNIVWFLWLNGILGSVYAVSLSAFYFALNELIARKYSSEILKTFQYSHEYFRLIGGVLSLIILIFINSVNIGFIIFQILLEIALILSILYYKFIVKKYLN